MRLTILMMRLTVYGFEICGAGTTGAARAAAPPLPFANGGSIALSRKVELFITGNNLCDVDIFR